MTKSKTVLVLQRAKKRIELGWTTGTLARGQHNEDVPPGSPDAKCWCLEGALLRGTSDIGSIPHGIVYNKAYKLLLETSPRPGLDLYQVNDSYKTNKPILAWIDRAIESAANNQKNK